MLKTDVGPRLYNQGLAVTSLTQTPLNDRANIIRRINLSNPSANDDWQVLVGQREIMRFRELTTGNQHLFRVADGSAAPKLDFWEFCQNVLQLDASIPVPNGMSCVIQSVGGATADIDIEFKEVDNVDASAWPTNHYLKNSFIIPIAWRLNSSVSATGVTQLDTQTAPPYVPNLFGNVAIPVSWQIRLLALFLEGMGVNTFSGAANHQSVIDSLRWVIDQKNMFTRVGAGIPNEGSASAAGSANTVFGQRSGIFRPFENNLPTADPVWDTPLTLGGGETSQLLWNITGDVTGGASYANALVVAIAQVTVPGAGMGT